ncbi:MAG: hypothetical protein ABMA15_30865, partial [Vicinamibacterales bacterium]
MLRLLLADTRVDPRLVRWLARHNGMLTRYLRDPTRTPASTVIVCTLTLLAWSVVSGPRASAQRREAAENASASLERSAPDLHARLVGLERAQGVLFGALVAGKGKVDEADLFQRMNRRLSDTSASARPDPEADKGFAALGAPADAIIRRAYAFQREVAAVFASRPPRERKAGLDAAVAHYRSRPDLALPDAAKDMTILYDHPYTSFIPPTPPETEPRRKLAYPTLTGLAWSAHWYELAALQPLESFGQKSERERDLAVVANRLTKKLSFGKPPDAFPTELPLAPAIAPGLVALHERAASVIDNLNLMQDVITDVLVRSDVP